MDANQRLLENKRNSFHKGMFFVTPIVFYALPHGNPVLICSYIDLLPLTYGTLYSGILPIPVSSPIEMIESIIHRLDQKEDFQVLGKLIFPAFAWNVRQERNSRIFKNKSLPMAIVERRIQSQIRSRIVFLGLKLPENIDSNWDLPPDREARVPIAVSPLPSIWLLSIAKSSSWIIGICWSNTGFPCQGVSLEDSNVFHAVGVIVELMPPSVDQFALELKLFFIKMVRSPADSDWTHRFRARTVHHTLNNRKP